MKNLLILGPVVVIILIVFVMSVNTSEAPKADPNSTPSDVSATPENTEGQETPTELTNEPATKLKADTFSGTLESVDISCLFDGECFIMVDGKKVTAIMGFSQETVGSVQGVEGFSDLENYIGQPVEVYAKDNSDGTYTLYGSEGFYIKLLP